MATAPEPRFPEDLQLLQAIRHDLALKVAPELSSDMARDVCRMTVDILDRLQARHTADVSLGEADLAHRAALLREGAAVLARSGEAAPEVPSLPVDAGPLAIARAQDRALGEMMARLLRLAQADPQAAGAVDALVARLVNGEQARSAASATAAGTDAEQFAEARAASEAKITLERLQEYLRGKFPEHAGLTVTAMRELPGGFGKTTVLFDVDGLPTMPRSMVMRRDRAAGATEATVLDEYAVIEAVQGYDLAAPEPLWLEPDPAALDLPFLVVGRLPGKPAGSIFAPDMAACNADTAYDLARIIAKLHTIPLDTVGQTGAWSPAARADAIGENIRYITDLWHRTQLEPDPVLDMCLEWLAINQPPAPKRPVLVHSDIGFHNLLVEDFKISGLLDWELAHPGDANEDLCYVRPYVEQLVPWDSFVEHYLAEGGQPYEPTRTKFYAVWRDVRNAVFTGLCHKAFCEGRNTDVRFAHSGVMYLKLLTQIAANRILAD